MKRIRIGKDINIKWVLQSPSDVILTPDNLTIELKDPKGRSFQCEYVFDTPVVEGYVVVVSLNGNSFNILGNYTLSAWLNKGEQGQSVVDAVNAFTLVGSTQAEGDSQSRGCGCLNLATIDLQGDISYIGQRGEKGEKGEQGERGLQGEQGIQGEKGEKGEKGEQGERGLQGEQGIQGVAGQDGVSPAVTIETIQGGHRMTVTDAEHPQGQSFDVMDGKDAPAVTEIFWATYGTTTATEIQTALDAGKVVMCKSGTFIYTLTDNNDILFKFFSFYNICTFKSFSVTKSDSVWSKIATYSSLLTVDIIASTATTTPSDIMVYSALATKNLVDTVDAKIGQSVSFTFTYEDDTTQTYNLLTSNT